MKYPNILASTFALAACVPPSPEPAPPPVAAPAPAPAPAPVVEQPEGSWTDWSIAPGNWVYRTDGRGSLALFGIPDTDATLLVRCDAQLRKIFLSRAGNAPSATQMTIRTSYGARTLPARSTGGQPLYIAAELQPYATVLDEIAFSRGRFAVELPGTMSVAIPTWPEFARVVEDCRG